MTAYQQWQYDRYGNALPDGTCELEHGTLAAEESAKWVEDMGELRLMEEEN